MTDLPPLDADILVANVAECPRDIWLELRRTGIGSSEAAGTLGLSPWHSPVSIWMDKLHPAPDEDRPEFEAGRRAEPMIAQWYADHTGWVVTHHSLMLRSRRTPFMLANPDRFVIDGNGEWRILEMKNVDRSKAHEWKDGPPLHVRLQGLHQLYVCGDAFTTVDFAACFGGNAFDRFEVTRDDELLADLIAGEEKFWTLVQMQRMPDTDGSEATREALRRYYAHTSQEEVEVGEEFMDALAQRQTAKALLADATRRVNEAEARMMTLMGGADVARHEGRVVATWKPVKRGEYVVAASETRRWNIPKGN